MSAEAVWQQLVKPTATFHGRQRALSGRGRRTDLNNCGQPVTRCSRTTRAEPTAGDGWLRYFRSSPSQNKNLGLHVFGDAQPVRDRRRQPVRLDYDMQGVAFTSSARRRVSLGTSSVPWAGLKAGAEVRVGTRRSNDGKQTTTGADVEPSPTAAANAAPVAQTTPITSTRTRPLSVHWTRRAGQRYRREL